MTRIQVQTPRHDLGTSTRAVKNRLQALQERIEDLEEERDVLRDRVQNLETIVTNEAWITEHEETDAWSLDATGAEKLSLSPDWKPPPSEAEHTAEIARQLRGQ